jgi:tungstate transport system ATP-binding protein
MSAAPTGALLVAEGISVRHGERTLLDACSIHLSAGETCVLTGDNGSGKTTLLRVLCGLDRVQAGSVRFAGQSLAGALPPALRRALQYVPAHPYLFATSVRANIDYGLRAQGVDLAERGRRTDAAIDWARLSTVIDAPPQRLSSGEKQRVAIARARVLEPRVVLLDEPTANLDRGSRQQVIELIAELSRAGTAVLIAAHDRELIELSGARRLHLEDGQVLPVDCAR